jgi:hypothetical protein
MELDAWILRKEEIRVEVAKYKGEKNAVKFMEYYGRKYDSFQKELLDWRLCMSLFDDYFHCKNKGTRWYGCVGPGGTGKSTLMQNIFYFLDDKFTLEKTNMNIKEFINCLDNDEIFDGMRALFMDEPDDDIHPQTELGKKLRKILGKARQARFFFGTCATDLTDIPPYLFRKIDIILFTPSLGHFMLIKNRPKLREYPIQEVRRDYQQMGYKIFYKVAGEYSVLNGWTGQAVPFSVEDIDKYKRVKWKDFRSDVKDLQALLNKPDGKQVKAGSNFAEAPIHEARHKKTLEVAVMRYRKLGHTQAETAVAFGMGVGWVKELEARVRIESVMLSGGK